MVDLECKLRPETLREFESNIDEMVKVTGKETGKVVRNTCRDLTRAAMYRTEGAEKGKERFLRVDTDYRTQKSGKPIYLPARRLKPKHRGKGFIAVPAGEPTDRRLKVKRGLLKAGWLGCMRRLGMRVKNVPKSADKHSEAFATKDWNSVVFGNTTPFIEDYNNGRNRHKTPLNILEHAMRDVNAKTRKRLDAMTDKILKKGKFR